MSHRPIVRKKANRLRKALRRTPDRHIDLVEWMVARHLAPTRKAARAMILDGKVKSESHTVGRDRLDKDSPYYLVPVVRAELRKTLRVDA